MVNILVVFVAIIEVRVSRVTPVRVRVSRVTPVTVGLVTEVQQLLLMKEKIIRKRRIHQQLL